MLDSNPGRRGLAMSRRALLILALLGCAAHGPTAVLAQATACRTNPDTAGLFVHGARLSYTVSDSSYLKARASRTPPSEITSVTDPEVCQAAVTAYNQALGRTGKPTAVTSVYVLAIGSSGYRVMDPMNTIR